MGRIWDDIYKEFRDGREFTTADATSAAYPQSEGMSHDDYRWKGYYSRAGRALAKAYEYGLVTKRVEWLIFGGRRVFWRIVVCTD